MSLVTLNICGRRYEVGCQDGQEDQVLTLASDLDRKAQALAKETGALAEGIVLVLTGLTLIDEVKDLQVALTETRNDAEVRHSEMHALLKTAEADHKAALAQCERLQQEKGLVDSQLDDARAALEAAHKRLQLYRDEQSAVRGHEENMAAAIEALAARIETVAQTLHVT